MSANIIILPLKYVIFWLGIEYQVESNFHPAVYKYWSIFFQFPVLLLRSSMLFKFSTLCTEYIFLSGSFQEHSFIAYVQNFSHMSLMWTFLHSLHSIICSYFSVAFSLLYSLSLQITIFLFHYCYFGDILEGAEHKHVDSICHMDSDIPKTTL